MEKIKVKKKKNILMERIYKKRRGPIVSTCEYQSKKISVICHSSVAFALIWKVK
jgi:hypothetical protein